MALDVNSLEEDVAEMEALQVRLGWMSRRKMEQELNAFNLTLPQYVALRCIEKHPEGCSMSELAESSQQVPATMTGVIDRLAERGFVVRKRSLKDRRELRVALTPAGKEVQEQIRKRIRVWIRQFMSALSAEERRAILELGQKYLAAIESTLPQKQD